MLDNYLFLEDDTANEQPVTSKWNVLVVDDDMEVHVVTRFCLSEAVIANRSLNLIDVYSARDAIELLKVNDDIDLILLDVVMETHDAGLEVARWVHEDAQSGNKPKIILRSGQPGFHSLSEIADSAHINAIMQKSTTNYATLIKTVASLLVEPDCGQVGQ